MLANLGLLALRVTLGLVFLGHGAQKAFGAFGGPGFNGMTGFIGSLGLRPARFWTGLAVGGEIIARTTAVASTAMSNPSCGSDWTPITIPAGGLRCGKKSGAACRIVSRSFGE